MKDYTVTQWFDVAACDPVHPGEYEIEILLFGWKTINKMCTWNGVVWEGKGLKPSAFYGDRWRGLAEKPLSAASNKE